MDKPTTMITEQQTYALGRYTAALGMILARLGYWPLIEEKTELDSEALTKELAEALATGAHLAVCFGLDPNAVDERAAVIYAGLQPAEVPQPEVDYDPKFSAGWLRWLFLVEGVTELPFSDGDYWSFDIKRGVLWRMWRTNGEEATFEDLAAWFAAMPDDAARDYALTRRSSVAMGKP